MFAVVAAILIALYAFGVRAPTVNLFDFGIAFLALHFAFDWLPPVTVRRRTIQQQQ
jgi:hypothetical protein